MGAILDCIFPTEEKPTADQATALKTREEEQPRKVEDSTAPDKFADAFDKLLEDENERLKSVENRLGRVLGLTSITATLLVSGTMALVSGSLGNISRTMRGLAALGIFYPSLQIICSTLAAVRGLGRATWLRPSVGDLVPDPGRGPISVARERAIGACKRYQATDRNVNFKVTQMAIAHTAIRNFAAGSVMIAVWDYSPFSCKRLRTRPRRRSAETLIFRDYFVVRRDRQALLGLGQVLRRLTISSPTQVNQLLPTREEANRRRPTQNVTDHRNKDFVNMFARQVSIAGSRSCLSLSLTIRP